MRFSVIATSAAILGAVAMAMPLADDTGAPTTPCGADCPTPTSGDTTLCPPCPATTSGTDTPVKEGKSGLNNPSLLSTTPTVVDPVVKPDTNNGGLPVPTTTNGGNPPSGGPPVLPTTNGGNPPNGTGSVPTVLLSQPANPDPNDPTKQHGKSNCAPEPKNDPELVDPESSDNPTGSNSTGSDPTLSDSTLSDSTGSNSTGSDPTDSGTTLSDTTGSNSTGSDPTDSGSTLSDTTGSNSSTPGSLPEPATFTGSAAVNSFSLIAVLAAAGAMFLA